MHPANMAYWQSVKKRNPEWFKGVEVVEFGSYNINGTVRELFDDCHYVGVDWRPGPSVDVVGLAHVFAEHSLEGFDVVISASMLEHDPHWKKSLKAMAKCLVPGGVILLSWGAAANPPHEHETATDGCFHALSAGKVIRSLVALGIYVHEFRYEKNLGFEGFVEGGVCLVGLKPWPPADVSGRERWYAGLGERTIDPLDPEDEVEL